MSILYPFVKKTLAKTFAFRSDGVPTAPTYFPWDFGGFTYEPYTFESYGCRIQGYRYTYGKDEPKGLIVFHHGLGAGHFSYTALIYDLCKMGYVVYAYDNVGCCLSEGRCIFNMGLSAVTQRDFFEYLDKDPKAKGLKRYVVGHSWGGWTALCALCGDYKVEKVISFAGFTSLQSIYSSKSPKGKPMNPSILKDMDTYQKKEFGDITRFDALEVLKTTETKVLYIQGNEDKMVDYERNGKRIQEVAKANPNVTVLIRKGMNHNPYWTKEGEAYYFGVSKGKNAFHSLNREKNVTYDRRLLTENDPEILKAVNDFLLG